MNKNKHEKMKLILLSLVFLNSISLISCDICNIKAECHCAALDFKYINVTNEESTSMFHNVPNTQITPDSMNICDLKNPVANTTTKHATKYVLNCTHVDISNSSTTPPASENNELFTLVFDYFCNSPTPKSNTSYSTGSILVIIFLTCVFSYLGLGMCVNFFLIGARGVEMFPHLDFWKDFPALVLDGVKFLQNGCNSRPSDLTTAASGSEGYDAI